MNHIKQFTHLKNNYFAIRHGQSVANEEGIIISDPVNGVDEYGLTQEGRNQVTQSIQKHLTLTTDLATKNKLSSDAFIFHSDFKRAKETAEIVYELLGCRKAMMPETRLRERHFGDFELTSNSNYDIVWNNDANDGAHTIDNVESAEAVMQRATELVLYLEESYQGETILLVAHGDTIQILQTAFGKQPASKQREFPHLETAEIREFLLV